MGNMASWQLATWQLAIAMAKRRHFGHTPSQFVLSIVEQESCHNGTMRFSVCCCRCCSLAAACGNNNGAAEQISDMIRYLDMRAKKYEPLTTQQQQYQQQQQQQQHQESNSNIHSSANNDNKRCCRVVVCFCSGCM